MREDKEDGKQPQTRVVRPREDGKPSAVNKLLAADQPLVLNSVRLHIKIECLTERCSGKINIKPKQVTRDEVRHIVHPSYAMNQNRLEDKQLKLLQSKQKSSRFLNKIQLARDSQKQGTKSGQDAEDQKAKTERQVEIELLLNSKEEKLKEKVQYLQRQDRNFNKHENALMHQAWSAAGGTGSGFEERLNSLIARRTDAMLRQVSLQLRNTHRKSLAHLGYGKEEQRLEFNERVQIRGELAQEQRDSTEVHQCKAKALSKEDVR